MDNIRVRIEEMLDELKKERDEIHVKLHLAKMDVGDEWDELGIKLARLEDRARELGGATAESSRDIGAAAKMLAEEIRDGFRLIAKHF